MGNYQNYTIVTCSTHSYSILNMDGDIDEDHHPRFLHRKYWSFTGIRTEAPALYTLGVARLLPLFGMNC